MQVQERRRNFDSSPRATYAPSTVQDQTKLVCRNGYAHCALLALGFVELISEGEHVLMLAPEGWGEVA